MCHFIQLACAGQCSELQGLLGGANIANVNLLTSLAPFLKSFARKSTHLLGSPLGCVLCRDIVLAIGALIRGPHSHNCDTVLELTDFLGVCRLVLSESVEIPVVFERAEESFINGHWLNYLHLKCIVAGLLASILEEAPSNLQQSAWARHIQAVIDHQLLTAACLECVGLVDPTTQIAIPAPLLESFRETQLGNSKPIPSMRF